MKGEPEKIKFYALNNINNEYTYIVTYFYSIY